MNGESSLIKDTFPFAISLKIRRNLQDKLLSLCPIMFLYPVKKNLPFLSLSFQQFLALIIFLKERQKHTCLCYISMSIG